MYDAPQFRGSPWHRDPRERHLRGFKCMGIFIGDDQWVAERTVERAAKRLAALKVIVLLQDTTKITNSLQAQLLLMRHCVNAGNSYALRLTSPAALRSAVTFTHPAWHAAAASAAPAQRMTAAAAIDAPIQLALSHVLKFDECSRDGQLALRQAALPLGLGGLGLTTAADLGDASFAGSLGAAWRAMRRHVPDLRVDVEGDGA